MDGPRDYHTKWSKSDRERQVSYDIAYMWNLKKNFIYIYIYIYIYTHTRYKTYLQNRNRLTDLANELVTMG